MAPLTPEKLTDIWKSGYCRATVEYGRLFTDDTPDGSLRRISWLRGHIPQCPDCAFAARLKAVEETLAQQIGPRAHAAFLLGRDTVEQPGYNDNLMREAIGRLAAEGHLTPAFVAWLGRVAKRGPYDPQESK